MYTSRVTVSPYYQQTSSTATPQKHTVTLVGHSFITRLCKEIHRGGNHRLQKDLGLNQISLGSIARGGWKLKDVSAALATSNSLTGIVFVQIGGNDIDLNLSWPHNCAELVDGVLNIAQNLTLNPRIELVIIGQLFHRSHSRFLPSSEAVTSYNQAVDHINEGLKAAAHSLKSTSFWRHRGARDTRLLSEDGTHLGPDALQKYYNSVRGAILVGLKLVASQGSI